MSQKLLPLRLFLITYDDGEGTQTIKVPVFLYENHPEFRKNIISFKCLSCNYESHFDCIEKESKN